MSNPAPTTESRLAALETALLRLIQWSGAGETMVANVERLRGGAWQAWRPIETALKGPDILLWVPRTEVVIGNYDLDLRCWTSRNPSSNYIAWDRVDDPTHWMPLPSPPAQGGE